MKYSMYVFCIWLIITTVSCGENPESKNDGTQIAFIADIHLQDVYGNLQESEYLGMKNPKNGRNAIIRTMNSQLHSTRIFNENYFAFLAALDDVVKRKVKYVVLPGDFSDDGQPININGLKRILDQYSKEYGTTFLLITGNHDPVKPFAQEAGKNDFLGKGGKSQPIMSKEKMYFPDPKLEHPVVVSRDIQELGYKEITTILGDYGFFPKKENIYWESPFSTYNYDSYNFEIAQKQSSLENRKYFVSSNKNLVPDVSYLVEPIKDIWFLAIDANVYIPFEEKNDTPIDPNNYSNASIGYNNVLSHKRHLIDWVKSIIVKAEKQGKTLIPFSHFPMVEFNDDASEHIIDLLGKDKMQLHRVPKEDVANIFADAGLQFHFGGHMHINDTGIRRTEKGNTIINIQVPSLAAYIPAYKLLTLKSNSSMEVETVILDSVPRFDELFDFYKEEYDFLESIGSNDLWNKDILSSKNYHEYTNWHLKELVRLRFLPNDWPSELTAFLLSISGKDLLTLAHVDSTFAFNDILKNTDELASMDSWKVASQMAVQSIKNTDLRISQFDKWNGFDLIFDFYRLRSADKLAIKDIGVEKMKQYEVLLNSFLNPKNQIPQKDLFKKNIHDLLTIFQHFLNGAPADNFELNLETGKIKNLSTSEYKYFDSSK